MMKQSQIKTKYTEQLIMYIEESQITKEICEDLDPIALENRIKKAEKKHEDVGKFIKNILKKTDREIISKQGKTSDSEFSNFKFNYAGVKGVPRCETKLQEYHDNEHDVSCLS